MAALNTLFPLTVSQWTKTVRYSTDVIVGRNGQEVRNALWQDPLLSFNAAFAVRSYADIDTLVAFFHAMRGRERSFLVKDWSDFQVMDWTAVTETGGARTTFQLVKRYTNTAAGDYVRTIRYPKASSVTAQVSGSAYGGSVSVSTTTGIVTLGTSQTPSNVKLRCSEFYVPCRFDADELPVEMLSYWVASGGDHAQVQVPDIPMVEVRGE